MKQGFLLNERNFNEIGLRAVFFFLLNKLKNKTLDFLPSTQNLKNRLSKFTEVEIFYLGIHVFLKF